VAPERMDEMVPADRQGVPVTGDHPHVQVWPGGGDPGGDGRSAPVDAVHAIGVYVVDEAPRATDPAHEHRLMRRHAQLGQERLNRGEDGVVAAPGAPPDFLVAGEVPLGERAAPWSAAFVSVALAHPPS